MKGKEKNAKKELAKIYYNNTNEAAAKKLGISVSTLNKKVKAAKIGLKFQ
jgi:predicted DNA-binding protein (UPF0251 family)